MRTVIINKTAFPILYSVRAAIEIGKRYGSVNKALFGAENEGETIERVLDTLTEMLKAGKTYAEKEAGAKLPELPDREAMLDGLSYKQIVALRKEIVEAINEDDRSDFSAEGSGKNA